MYKLTLLYWAIALYRPDWMIASFIPPLSFLPGMNKYLLLGVFFSTFLANKPTREYSFILPFFLLCGISLLWAENTGPGRLSLIQLVQYYMLGVITFTYIDDLEKVRVFFRMFLFHFLYYGSWGLIYLGTVAWHNRLNEQDAFGPYMLLGVIFSFFYLFGEKNKFLRLLCMLTIVVCSAGAVLSFTMGTFLTFLILGGYVLFRYPHKIKAVMIVAVASFLFVILVSYSVSDPQAYWQEMSKIYTDTGGSGTGGERLFLWRMALRIFAANPILGVGLNNFGIHAPRVATMEDILESNSRFEGPENLWGFSLHNAHLEVLVELGIVGMIVYLWFFYDFWKKNISVRGKISEMLGSATNFLNAKRTAGEKLDLPMLYSTSIALEGMLIIYIFTGTVYGLLFYPDFWITIIANRMLHKIFVKTYN